MVGGHAHTFGYFPSKALSLNAGLIFFAPPVKAYPRVRAGLTRFLPTALPRAGSVCAGRLPRGDRLQLALFTWTALTMPRDKPSSPPSGVATEKDSDENLGSPVNPGSPIQRRGNACARTGAGCSKVSSARSAGVLRWVRDIYTE